MINVIIPHYRHQCYLPDAIAALGNMAHDDNCRVLIFNDEPGINLSEYHQLYSYRMPILIFDDNKNKGQAARFNKGIRFSSEDGLYFANWVAFHGADDYVMPWKFGIFENAINNYGFDVLYTDAVQLDVNNNRTYIKSEEFDIDVFKMRNFIVASTVFVRANLAAEVLFDEDLHYGEDWLFYHKLYKAGARFKYIPIPTMYYRDYTSNIGVRYGENWDVKRLELRRRIADLYK